MSGRHGGPGWLAPRARTALLLAGLLVPVLVGWLAGWTVGSFAFVLLYLIAPESVRLLRTLRRGGENELAVRDGRGAAFFLAVAVLLPFMIDHTRREVDEVAEVVQYTGMIWTAAGCLLISTRHTVRHYRRDASRQPELERQQ